MPNAEQAAASGTMTPVAVVDSLTRTRYEATRLQSFIEWWQMPVLVLCCVIVLVFVAYMYRRDSVELRPGVGVLLALLRLAAFAGVLLMFLDVQKHTRNEGGPQFTRGVAGRHELEHEPCRCGQLRQA